MNTPSANEIEGIIRLRNKKKRTDIPEGIGPLSVLSNQKDAAKLHVLAREIAQGRLNTEDILLVVGYGLPKENMVPLRLPSIILPALQIQEQCRNRGLSIPKLRVYQETDLISQINNLEREQTQNIAAVMSEYLRLYVERYHNLLLADVQIDFGIESSNEVERAIEEISDRIRGHAKQHSIISEQLQHLTSCADKHSNGGGHIHYAAANALCSGAFGNEFQHSGSKHVSDSKIIFPIGGKPEEPFFTITSHFAEQSHSKVIPLLAKHLGFRPPYYSAGKLEVGNNGSLPRFSAEVKDGPIRRDFIALEADGVSIPELAELHKQALSSCAPL